MKQEKANIRFGKVLQEIKEVDERLKKAHKEYDKEKANIELMFLPSRIKTIQLNRLHWNNELTLYNLGVLRDKLFEDRLSILEELEKEVSTDNEE